VAQAVARVGYRPDDKEAFQPHLTLARFKIRGGRDRSAGPPAPDLTPLVRRYEGWSAGTFRVGEVVAFSSVLRAEGPEYAALSRARLKGRKNES
jgi:2'-5' RNA ligase